MQHLASSGSESPVKAAKRIWEAKVAEDVKMKAAAEGPRSPSSVVSSLPGTPVTPTRTLINSNHLKWSRSRSLFGVGGEETALVSSMSVASNGSVASQHVRISKGGEEDERHPVCRKNFWEQRIAAVQVRLPPMLIRCFLKAILSEHMFIPKMFSGNTIGGVSLSP